MLASPGIFMGHLDDVQTHVSHERWPEALVAALAAWRELRSPERAAVIDQIDARLDPPPLNPTTFHEDWLAQAHRDDPAAIGQLARRLPERMPLRRDPAVWEGWVPSGMVARLDALKPHLPDPRVGRALASQIHHRAFAWAHAEPHPYVLALQTLIAAGDDESLDRMPQANREQWGPTFLLLALSQRAVRKRPPTDPDGPRWAALAEALTPSPDAQEAALVEAIQRDPSDVGLRLVYADLLQGRGDLRGEFIALQLAGEDDPAALRQAQRLASAHKQTWLGDDLAAVLDPVRWSGGFPVAAVLQSSGAASESVWTAAAADPRHRTLRWIAKGQANNARYESFLANNPNLRHLDATTDTVWQWIVEGRFPDLQSLSITAKTAEKTLRRLGRLPATLREVHVRVPLPLPIIDALDAIGAGQHVESLVIPRSSDGYTWSLLAPILEKAWPALRIVWLGERALSDQFGVGVVRDPGGDWDGLICAPSAEQIGYQRQRETWRRVFPLPRARLWIGDDGSALREELVAHGFEVLDAAPVPPLWETL